MQGGTEGNSKAGTEDIPSTRTFVAIGLLLAAIPACFLGWSLNQALRVLRIEPPKWQMQSLWQPHEVNRRNRNESGTTRTHLEGVGYAADGRCALACLAEASSLSARAH